MLFSKAVYLSGRFKNVCFILYILSTTIYIYLKCCNECNISFWRKSDFPNSQLLSREKCLNQCDSIYQFFNDSKKYNLYILIFQFSFSFSQIQSHNFLFVQNYLFLQPYKKKELFWYNFFSNFKELLHNIFEI